MNSHPERKWKLKNTRNVQDRELLFFPRLSFHSSFYCLQALNSFSHRQLRLGKYSGENILHHLILSLSLQSITGICYERPIGKTGYWAIWAIGLTIYRRHVLTVHRLETVIIGESLQLPATVIQLPGLLNIFINVKNDAVTVGSILIDSKYL